MKPVTSIGHHSSTLVAEVGQVALIIRQLHASAQNSYTSFLPSCASTHSKHGGGNDSFAHSCCFTDKMCVYFSGKKRDMEEREEGIPRNVIRPDPADVY